MLTTSKAFRATVFSLVKDDKEKIKLLQNFADSTDQIRVTDASMKFVNNTVTYMVKVQIEQEQKLPTHKKRSTWARITASIPGAALLSTGTPFLTSARYYISRANNAIFASLAPTCSDSYSQEQFDSFFSQCQSYMYSGPHTKCASDYVVNSFHCSLDVCNAICLDYNTGLNKNLIGGFLVAGGIVATIAISKIYDVIKKS